LKFPIEGVVRGNLTAEGQLGALKTSGQLTLTKGRLPLGWSGTTLTNVEASGTFSGQSLRLERATGLHPSGDFSATGEIDFTNFRDPALKLGVNSAKSRVPLFAMNGAGGLNAETSLALQLSGPLSAARVTGEAKVASVAIPDLTGAPLNRLVLEDWVGSLPPVVAFDSTRWSDWQFDIHAASQAATVSADLRLTGTGAAPALVGSAAFSGVPVPDRGLLSAPKVLTVQSAAFEFVEGFPGNPIIAVEATGRLANEPYTVWLTGTLQNPMRVFGYAPPLTEKAIRALLSGEMAAKYFTGDNRFNLLVPAELRDGVEITEWEEIETPVPPPPPAPAPPEPGAEATPAPAPVGPPP
jgi:hypothetical protein